MAQTPEDYDWEVTTEEFVDLERTPDRRVWHPGTEPQDNKAIWLLGAATVLGAGALWWFFLRDDESDSNGTGEADGGGGTTGTGGTTGGGTGGSGSEDDDDIDPIGDGGNTGGGGLGDLDPIFGEAPFPPEPAGVQWDHLERLATKAEELTKMNGFRDYLLGVAEWESDGVPTAWNNKGDSKPAMKLFCQPFNHPKRFKDNPWRPDTCVVQRYSDMTDPLSKRWAWSGGWFQMMTSTALATADEYGHNMDPARIFDPPFQVAFAADLARDFRKGWGARTWGDVRAGWALPKWANHENHSEGKANVIARFKKALNRVPRSVDKELWKKEFTAKHYPGFKHVLHELLKFEGRLA